jgi:hypothetical protein
MPIIQKQCVNNHVADQYVPRIDGPVELRDCKECGEPLFKAVASFGQALTYFRENNAQIIANLDPNTPITGHEHHKRVMKEKGLEPLTDWHTSKSRSRM